jgi:hypothetical protein
MKTDRLLMVPAGACRTNPPERAPIATCAVGERLVSPSHDRPEQLEEADFEILQQSDLLICLVRDNGHARAADIHRLLERAGHWRKPLLEMRLAVSQDGSPELTSRWHRRELFDIPALPEELCAVETPAPGPPTIAEYVQSLKDFASRQAEGRHISCISCA